ncbi:HMG box family protein [Tritrichomonas foetus]|uniref:HMG box family protein n=1 Tax=Tritrichomonas foetus TaxID=1144522 RepID=A0A1J4KSV0_9EUKA|nr:HMG box family protein [Tritrichomonas foetus]|eukprot:OHT12557.1 HMG box family protein [Tritrichomonas foetus]
MNGFDPTLDEPFGVSQPLTIPETSISDKPVKRPPNAYNLFFIERQPIERENNPKLTGNEVSQLIGKQWKEMTEEQQLQYKEKANQIRAKFKEEHPDYHYQKGSDKQRKKKKNHSNLNILGTEADLFGFLTEEPLSSQTTLEAQLKNLFTLIGQAVITKYLTTNQDEMKRLINNFQLPDNTDPTQQMEALLAQASS